MNGSSSRSVDDRAARVTRFRYDHLRVAGILREHCRGGTDISCVLDDIAAQSVNRVLAGSAVDLELATKPWQAIQRAGYFGNGQGWER